MNHCVCPNRCGVEFPCQNWPQSDTFVKVVHSTYSSQDLTLVLFYNAQLNILVVSIEPVKQKNVAQPAWESINT